MEWGGSQSESKHALTQMEIFDDYFLKAEPSVLLKEEFNYNQSYHNE